MAELTISEIISLVRKISQRNLEMHQGIWNKTANYSHEVRSKTLGIIGYGRIGTQVSVLAEALGMKVKYYDLEEKMAIGNAQRVSSFEDLLSSSDIISLHIDGREENNNLISQKEFQLMKDETILINHSRGKVVDLKALVKNLKLKKIAGAGIDVFPDEPKKNTQNYFSELNEYPEIYELSKFINVILTPHIGGSTIEAQEAIANFCSHRLDSYYKLGDTSYSANFPSLSPGNIIKGHSRLIHLHINQAGVLAGINEILAEQGLNIEAQMLKTQEQVGYAIIDVSGKISKKSMARLEQIPGTIMTNIKLT